MLSEYTIKYIDLLKEEIELYNWAKNNAPTEFNLDDVLVAGFERRGIDGGLCSAVLLKKFTEEDNSNSFGESLVSDHYSNYSRQILDWCKNTDVDKACVYLAKKINYLALQNKEIREVNEKYYFKYTTFENDFNSLPLQEIFLKTTEESVDDIEFTTVHGFANFDENESFYAKHGADWSNKTEKENFLRWFLLAGGYGDVSIQVTNNSYTQIGNPELSLDNLSTQNVDINNDVIYFLNGEVKKSSHDGEAFKKNIEPLENYALEIQDVSKYSILNISIEIMLDRLRTASNITSYLTSPSEIPSKSISYKLIFNIAEQKSVVVPSADMYQSLLYLKAMGTTDISLYYDSLKKRIVVRGKDFQKNIERQVIKAGSRFPTIEKEQVTIPTFSIIYEQDIADLTALSPVEYVQFFDKQLTFRDKYDLLNTKRNSPLDLPIDFVKEYPSVANSYSQQTEVALSLKDRDEKYNYVEKLMDIYLSTYTRLAVNGQGDTIRESIPTQDWVKPNYVLKVEEAYWAYNSKIKVSELLSFFVSKGNDAGYRMLCLKVLGVDYHLFEQAIINALLETRDIYVSKLKIDEQNITADVQYESKNNFIAGNIYDKKDYIEGSGGQNRDYSNNLSIFYGSDLGSSIYEKAQSTLEEAVASRFVPSLAPNARTEEEAKELELNIDIFCPIFFSGTVNAVRSKGDSIMQVEGALITGNKDNVINMTWSNIQSRHLPFGHFEVFKGWLIKNESQILGEYRRDEIIDAYVYPTRPQDYIANYVFPNFKDVNLKMVGFKSDLAGGKTLDMIKNASKNTLAVLKELGYTKSGFEITDEEAERLKKQFVLDFKARYWDARREGRRLFNFFLRKAIDNISRQQIDALWNKTYNNYAKPDLQKVPIFPSHNYRFGKKSEARKFELMDAQVEGVRHVISRENSGLLLHEVGFGKTTSSITAISSMMNTGEANRVMFAVPKAVYEKFLQEIKGDDNLFGLLPNVNVVLLGNLKESAIKKIKKFTKEELDTIANFKKFNREFIKLIGSLKRKRITLDNDPEYISSSNWSTAYSLIKKEIKSYVAKYEKLEVLNNHVGYLNNIYEEVNVNFQEYFEVRNKVIQDSSSTDGQIKKAQKEIQTEALKVSNRLTRRLKEYVSFVAVSLIDDLGYYLPEVMADKTIFIAQHSAISESLRPSINSVLRALMFKEGLGEPEKEVKTFNVSEWANVTGLTENKCASAIKILTRHPISLARLNIDGLVVDEIHNFNNIVSRAGSKGWFFQSNTYFSNPDKKRGSYGNDEFFVLEKVGGSTNQNRYDMKYDSTGKVSDANGSKLSAAALCFDIQYRSAKKNNVILLSATPFTDTPFQVLSVLGMTNYKMLLENGMETAWDFFNNYVDEVYKYDLRHDGGYGLFIDVNGYYNDKALSNLITNVANVKITDERIEANRPKKAIIPQNKISKDDQNKVSETTQMGDYFDVLTEVNSRIVLSEAQQKFAEIITNYLRDDNDQRPVKDIFPINEVRLLGIKQGALDEEIEEIVKQKIEDATDDVENADLFLTDLQALYDKGKFAQHPKIKEAIDHITVKILKQAVEKTDDDELEAVQADTRQISAVHKLAGKAIGCQQAQQSLVISPYLVNLGDDSYTATFLPDLEPNPAKTFVENSPKLLFVVKSIQQTIEYQKEQLKKGEIPHIGGQVVYFDRHNFSYGGKKYNAFELLAEYIVNNVDGITSNKTDNGEWVDIGIIDGKTKIEDTIKKDVVVKRGRVAIKDGFNDGSIKILIGSKAIKEGIDLQGNSHTMYICEAEFSPEVAMQLEGRIWRQKNPYDVVRVIYILAMNTIDSFVYSKINRKVMMIKRMLELGVYEMNTTQFTMDTKEMLLQLESDPDKLTQIQFQDEVVYLKNYLGTLGKKIERLQAVKAKYGDVEHKMSIKLPHLNTIYSRIGDAKTELIKGEIRLEIKKQKSAISMQEKIDSNFKGTAKEWAEEAKKKGKLDVTDKEIQDAYDAEIEKNPKRNPFPKLLTPLSMDSQFSEIEKVVIKVKSVLSLRIVEDIERVWRDSNEEEQKAIREKENKSAGERYWLAFHDTTGTLDLAGYVRSLVVAFIDDAEGINVVETYQAFIKNDGKTLDQIDEVINVFQQEYNTDASKLKDEAAFKASIRADWVKALADREEKTDLSLEGLVKTLEPSLELIKLRK